MPVCWDWKPAHRACCRTFSHLWLRNSLCREISVISSSFLLVSNLGNVFIFPFAIALYVISIYLSFHYDYNAFRCLDLFVKLKVYLFTLRPLKVNHVHILSYLLLNFKPKKMWTHLSHFLSRLCFLLHVYSTKIKDLLEICNNSYRKPMAWLLTKQVHECL